MESQYEDDINFNIGIYPNPTQTEKINLIIYNQFSDFPLQYRIYNNECKTVKLGNIDITNQTNEIPLCALTSGIYYIEVFNDKNKMTRKFVINK